MNIRRRTTKKCKKKSLIKKFKSKKSTKCKKKSLIKKSHKSVKKFKSKKSTKSKKKIRKLDKSVIENIVNDPSIFS